MQNFISGQRWINTLEPRLGLGTVVSTEHRSVTILFEASGEIRTYAKQSAPLTRIKFAIGDTILSREGREIRIESISEQQGLITYSGRDRDGKAAKIGENELDHFVSLDRPADRLFSGQIDADKWLELRYLTLLQRNTLFASELRGLTGCRTSLIPHQLYIAHEVSRRFAPRVLLADEVGLGKTIEAGLILHQQLITERAERVLIVVPESLLHQWLVEMIRRFNLYFSLFDESRCATVLASTGHDNPFFSEQLVLLSIDFLRENPQRAMQAALANWDLVVVDEAHHLQWSPEDASPEYRIVENLATRTKGLLLLTGTPEQLGKASHFASLRLLDPDRFPALEAFIDEEQDYEKTAAVIEALLDRRCLSEHEMSLLRALLAGEEDFPRLALLDTAGKDTPESAGIRREIIEHLVDRHGTGRVLFRNTRAMVGGFPERLAIPYPLPCPPAYRILAENAKSDCDRRVLCPETLYRRQALPKDPSWTDFDPRVHWLLERARSLRHRKILVITVSAQSALDLAEYLKSRAGIVAAVFHEQLSIVERDRAAAFFANPENGAPLLICSEIGSEGRNFQFCHDLILFDLPLNPDLLEQRIGRLDRIGQTQKITIHIPYLEGSAQEILYRWYQEGLDAFAKTCQTGHAVFVQLYERLLQALHESPESAHAFIEITRTVHAEQSEHLQRGRDRLLEYNSCRPETARKLMEQAQDEDRESLLPEYMEQVFDCFGVDSEPRDQHLFVLHPADHLAAPFPYLPDDGVTITFDRKTALAREDVQFITRDHPMVTRIMEQIVLSEFGNSAFTVCKTRLAKPGTLLLECLFILEAADSREVQGLACLAPTAIRVVVDRQGNDYAAALSHDMIRENQHAVDTETARRFIGARQEEIRELLQTAEQKANTKARPLIQAAEDEFTHKLNEEVNRLEALRRVNPNVRQEEIDYFRARLAAICIALESADVRLDALRVLLVI